ncbi:cell division protein ZapE [Paracoccus pacificus]|uniref:Cell division protein ZapE n=1 Tax=Paracoccus pacificus TaxID=1463598 RepID=A0ABW4R232_9RHOB
MPSVSQLYEARVARGELDPDPAQRALLPRLDALVGELAAAPPAPVTKARGGWLSRLVGGGPADATPIAGPRGLYIWGGVGRGKSMLMDLLVEAAPIAQKRRVHFHAFMQEVQAGLNRARAEGAQDAVRPVAEAIADQTRLFCFDEMQITDIADAMVVGRLFQVLFDRGVTIVTTSNRVPEDLYKDGLNRQLFMPFIALIRQKLDVIELASPHDHRQDGTAEDDRWFVTPPSARKAMDAAWARLTEGAPAAPLVLPIKGREIAIPAFATAPDGQRIGRIGFWDLCGRPYGPAEYLAIADAVDLLMIDDIPQLSSANYNEAKRFVTLIDALYEARVKLIASAAAQPESLYLEGTGSFEFERTASRLREMMDADWGKAG